MIANIGHFFMKSNCFLRLIIFFVLLTLALPAAASGGSFSERKRARSAKPRAESC